MSIDPGAWRTVEETAAHFRIGKKTVYKRCKSGVWPHHRNGTHVRAAIRFSPEDWEAIGELLRPSTVRVVVPAAPSSAQVQRALRRMQRTA